MFKVGDTVLYKTEGVCRIQEICSKDIGGRAEEYYLLRPVYRENSSVFVPVKNETLISQMKGILSADEIMDIINSVTQNEVEWIEDEESRRLKYKELINGGDRRAMLRAIKALSIKQKEKLQRGRKLHITDENFLHDAERIVYDEFALVLNLQPDEVLPFIMEKANVHQ